MADASSLRTLLKTLPAVRDDLAAFVMKPVAVTAAPAAVRGLARRGFLGCLPIGTTSKGHVVLRLEPGVPLDRSPVAMAWKDEVECQTFAPRIDGLVAGRLAQDELSNPADPLSDEQREELIRIAGQLGGEAPARRVLEAMAGIRAEPKGDLRAAAAWRAAGSEPLFEVLAGAHSVPFPDLKSWSERAADRFPGEPIAQRIYVARHGEEGGEKLIERAWQVALGDALFDTTYDGVYHGPSGDLSESALAKGSQALLREKRGRLAAPRKALWPAVEAMGARIGRVQGKEHLAAAKELAGKDPALAWTHLRNAAAFAARAKKKVPPAALELAAELAEANGWDHLRDLLAWT